MDFGSNKEVPSHLKIQGTKCCLTAQKNKAIGQNGNQMGVQDIKCRWLEDQIGQAIVGITNRQGKVGDDKINALKASGDFPWEFS